MYKIFFLFFTLTSVTILGQANQKNIIEDMTFLTGDELKGRKTGTDEALLSANYIAQQFKEIGLQSPDIADNYLHKFALTKSENLSRSLILNSLSITQDDFIVLSAAKKLHITNPSLIKYVFIGENDDFMTKFSEISGIDQSFMVLVHPVHKSRFLRLKNYLSRSSYNLQSNSKSFSVWVLSGEEKIDNLTLDAINKIDIKESYNVIGVLPAKNETSRNWMYSAHYDHIGILPAVDKDSIANGANDDASGVVAVIELARIFANKKTNEKNLWFVAFDAEELGLFGSQALADTLDKELIEGMINIEMIGFPNVDLGSSSAFISGYDLSYWPKKMAESIEYEEFVFFPDPYPQMQLFSRSDNASFAKYGVAAHSISTYSQSDKTYHQVSDDLTNIDFDHMVEVINAIYKSSIPLLKLDFEPGKIDFKTKTDR